jgi:hypothetical protein
MPGPLLNALSVAYPGKESLTIDQINAVVFGNALLQSDPALAVPPPAPNSPIVAAPDDGGDCGPNVGNIVNLPANDIAQVGDA